MGYVLGLWLLLIGPGLANGQEPKKEVQDPNKEWVGKKVIQKKLDFTLQVEKRRVGRPGEVEFYLVDKVEGPWLWLKHESLPLAGWAGAADVVPLDDAIDSFTEALRVKPNDADSLVLRGVVWLFEKNEADIAMADFDEAIKADPTKAWSHVWRGRAWEIKNDLDKAIADYGEAIKLDPGNDYALAQRGFCWISKKDYDKAIADYNTAIRLNPKVATTWHNRGTAWFNKKDFNKAVADNTQAIRINPKYNNAYYNRGTAYAQLRDWDKAIASYNEAIRLDSKFTVAYESRGDALYQKDEWDKAIADFDQVIKLAPNYSAGFNRRATAWIAKGEPDKAIADYNKAIALQPTNAQYYANRGVAWRDKQEFEKALVDANESVRLAPKDSVTLRDRAFIKMLARRNDAIDDFKGVLELEAWKGANSALSVVLGNLAARQAGKDDEAKKLLEDAAIKCDRNDWRYSIVKYLRGEIDEAALLAVAQNDAVTAEIRSCIGIDLALKKRKDEALAHLRWVRDHGAKFLFLVKVAVAELEKLEKSPGDKKP